MFALTSPWRGLQSVHFPDRNVHPCYQTKKDTSGRLYARPPLRTANEHLANDLDLLVTCDLVEAPGYAYHDG